MSEADRPAGATPEPAADADRVSPAVRTAVEIAVRLGAIALLVGACLVIVAPFVGVVLWALIIAIALEEPFEWLCARLGGRRALAGVLGVALVLGAIAVPTAIFSETTYSGARTLAASLRDGQLDVPPPARSVREWPIVGERAYDAWLAASDNLGSTLSGLEPQLRTASRWLLQVVGDVGAVLLQLVASIVLAGFMLVRSAARRRALDRFGRRMAGERRGAELVELTTATVRSVVQGIVGVAAIQSTLAGIGFLVAGVPGAGLWALAVLVAAVVQLPVVVVMVPPVLIVGASAGTGAAVILGVWCGAVATLDNVLKPILFARGARVPSLVIFLGAIGGLLGFGLIGLFLGAAILAVGYELFVAWLDDDVSRASETA